MLGNWIRPWPGEKLIGEIVAVSGDRLICRCPGGVEFMVLLSDVPKLRMYGSKAAANGSLGLFSGLSKRLGERAPWPS